MAATKCGSHVAPRGLALVVIVKCDVTSKMLIGVSDSDSTHALARGYTPPWPMGGKWVPHSSRHSVGTGHLYTRKCLQGARRMHVESRRVIPHHQHAPAICRLTNRLITELYKHHCPLKATPNAQNKTLTPPIYHVQGA